MSNKNNLITITEAINTYSLSRATLYRWIKQGKITLVDNNNIDTQSLINYIQTKQDKKLQQFSLHISTELLNLVEIYADKNSLSKHAVIKLAIEKLLKLNTD